MVREGFQLSSQVFELQSDYMVALRTNLPSYPALRAFLDHTTTSYHSSIPFDEVHSLLLKWYRQNRRHLPWRGDAPPYNGSTAGNSSLVRL